MGEDASSFIEKIIFDVSIFLFEQLYLFYYFTFLQIICKMGICTHIIIRFTKLLYRLLANYNVYRVLYLRTPWQKAEPRNLGHH